MKRILSLILILALGFALFGCDESELDKVVDKIDGITDGGSNDGGGTPASPSVSFNTLGGPSINPIEGADVLSVLPTPERDGCVFRGWFLDESLSAPAVLPLSVSGNMTLYAKWLRVSSTHSLKSSQIKWFFGSESEALYYVTPNGYDFRTLAEEGYRIKITVHYDVRYVKDYDIWLDIGYAGPPKYEVYLKNESGWGAEEEDIKTTAEPTRSSISIDAAAVDMIDERITLTFSTNNIQNFVVFENITVAYECYKQ